MLKNLKREDDVRMGGANANATRCIDEQICGGKIGALIIHSTFLEEPTIGLRSAAEIYSDHRGLGYMARDFSDAGL